MTDASLELIQRQLERVVDRLDSIEVRLTELKKINARFDAFDLRKRKAERHPNSLRHNELKDLLRSKEMTQTDLAIRMFGGRSVNKEGKNVPKHKDRVSEWVNNKGQPSKSNMKKIMEIFDLV